VDQWTEKATWEDVALKIALVELAHQTQQQGHSHLEEQKARSPSHKAACM
jgi:hypothetical protein